MGVVLVVAGAPFGLSLVLAAVAIGTALSLTGDCILAWTRATSVPAAGPIGVVIGTTVTSLVVLGASFASGASPHGCFLLWGAMVVGCAAWDRRRVFASRDRAEQIDMLLTAILAIGVIAWAWPQITAYTVLVREGHLPTWIDYYIHANTIAQLGSPFVPTRSSLLLAGQPAGFYHYGFAVIAAVLAGLLDVPSLSLACGILLAVGLLLMVLGAYALGAVLASRATGFVAAILMMILPDAAYLGLGNGFFSFHWLVFTSPGSGYTIGIVLCAAAMFALWRCKGGAGMLALGSTLALAAFAFRAHIFVLFAAALAAALAYESPVAKRHRNRIVMTATGLLGASAMLLLAVKPVRDAWLRFSDVLPYINFVHLNQGPHAYGTAYRMMVDTLGTDAAAVIGFVLIPLLIAGCFAVIFPLLLAITVRHCGWRPLDTFPVFVMLAYLGIVLLAPTPFTGDFTELKHRPFVLVYAVVLVWSAVLCERALQLLPIRAKRWLLCGGGVALLVIVLALGSGSAPGAPKMEWGRKFFDLPVTPGLVEVSRHVREARMHGDIFVVLPTEPGASLLDRATQVASLVDLPTYVGRPGIFQLRNDEMGRVAKSRIDEIDSIQHMSSAEEALAAFAHLGIRWIIVVGQDQPALEAGRPTFRRGDVSVFRTP